MDAHVHNVDDPFPCETMPTESERMPTLKYGDSFDCTVDGTSIEVRFTLQMHIHIYYITFSTGYLRSDWGLPLGHVPHVDLPAYARSAHIENWLRESCRHTHKSPYRDYKWSDVEMPQVIDTLTDLIVVDSFFRLR